MLLFVPYQQRHHRHLDSRSLRLTRLSVSRALTRLRVGRFNLGRHWREIVATPIKAPIHLDFDAWRGSTLPHGPHLCSPWFQGGPTLVYLFWPQIWHQEVGLTLLDPHSPWFRHQEGGPTLLNLCSPQIRCQQGAHLLLHLCSPWIQCLEGDSPSSTLVPFKFDARRGGRSFKLIIAHT